MKWLCTGARSCAFFLSVAAAVSTVWGAGPVGPGTPPAFAPLQAAYHGGDLVLAAAAGGARVTFPDGRTLALALPADAALTSLAAAGDGWLAAGSFAADDGRRRLLLLAGDERRAVRLSEPAGQRGRVRQDPVLLVDGGRLAGLAWLEGDGGRTLAVAAAVARGERSVKGWRRPQWVSQPGPGSQLALGGAVLDDGSWLLVWSAFDGGDDEIVWSRRVGESWLPAARVSTDNAVPDITPAVAPAGAGALLAWSRYDGADYRLMLARFDDGGWHDERAAGGPGTLYPSFAGARDRPRLLYYTAVPSGWTAAELDAAGALLGSIETATARSDRPLVLAAGGDGAPQLVWPGGGDAPAEER